MKIKAAVGNVVLVITGSRLFDQFFCLFSSKLGIRYAKPPTGDRRFQKPEAPDSWVGVKSANTSGSVCSQASCKKIPVDTYQPNGPTFKSTLSL